jgi:hypothetical protein
MLFHPLASLSNRNLSEHAELTNCLIGFDARQKKPGIGREGNTEIG